MSDDDRDWFAPRTGRNSEPSPPPRPRRSPRPSLGGPPRPPRPPRQPLYPDQQVWPPVPKPQEPVGSSTQPLPALPSAGPLPPRQPAAPPEEPTATPPPRRRRTLLYGLGTLAAFLIGIGAPTVDSYLIFKGGRPDDKVHLVPPGQSYTFEHVTWKAAIEPLDDPVGTTPTGPTKEWVKITIDRTAVDKDGTVLTGKPELQVKDRRDRAWQVEVDDDLPAEHEIGKTYTMNAFGVVPTGLAKEVELVLRPSGYRKDTPTEDLFRVDPDSTENDDDVLRFTR